VVNQWTYCQSLLALVTVLFLGGCATAPGPRFSGLDEIATDNAELVVYRKTAFFAAGQTMPLSIDGKAVGELYNGSFLAERIPPGSHTIKVSTGPVGQSVEKHIELAQGQRKFMHFDFPTGPFANVLFIGVTLIERDEQTALGDLKELSGAR